MVNKKAQGISISFIVVAAIAALVLVLVIAFTTGGLGKLFGGITQSTQGTELTKAQTDCTKYCNDSIIGISCNGVFQDAYGTAISCSEENCKDYEGGPGECPGTGCTGDLVIYCNTTTTKEECGACVGFSVINPWNGTACNSNVNTSCEDIGTDYNRCTLLGCNWEQLTE